MKKILILLILISSFAYGQQSNFTNTKFINGVAVSSGTTFPTAGVTYGMLHYKTTAPIGLHYWDGAAWQIVGIGGAGVTSFNTRTGAVTSVIGDYSSFYVTQGTNQTSGLTGNKTWSGDQQFQGGLSATGVLPLANNTYDIGDLLTNWRSIYVRKIANLTSNGLIKTTGADGTLSIATPGTDYGTVTSITPGWSFTSQTPITSTGTLTEDSTKVQTVLNFFPKGDTRYARTGATGTVTSVATGYGLSGGTITSTGTILVDSAALKANFIRNSTSLQASANFNISGTATAASFNAVELLHNPTTSTSSNFLGHLAGQFNSGTQSTGLGDQALQNNTGANSTATGLDAFKNNTAPGATGAGWKVGFDNIGDYPTLNGYFSGQLNKGDYVSGTGFYSLETNIADYVNGVGDLTLQFNTANGANAHGATSLNQNNGAYASGFGDNTGVYNEGAYNTYLGGKSGSTFLDNVAGNKTFAGTDVSGQNITVTAHGFGSGGTYRDLKYTVGSGGSIGGMTSGQIYSFYIVDANTLQSRCWSSCTPITSATGTGHTLTPQTIYTNATMVGANTVANASNRVILGDGSVTTVMAGQTGTASLTVGDDVYDSGWNGDLTVPTKNAIWDAGFATTAASVSSITGTANQITASASTGAVTLSLPTTITGLTSVSSTGFTGALTGNATTATTLATSRNIWGQSFNGSVDVTGSLTEVDDITGGASNMVITAGTGNSRTLGFRTTTTGGTATTALTLAIDQSATFANTVNATTFVGALTGNASTATALATGRTIGTLTGDVTSAGSSFDGTGNNTNATTLATVNSNVGSFGSATQVGTFTVNGKGLITAAGNTTVTPAVGSITGLGTGVATALAVNVGSAGAFITFNGDAGTPSALVGTNITGTASALNIGGNAATATTATNATNTAITDDNSTNATMYPTWVTAATGNLPQKVSSTGVTWNPSTQTLSPIRLSTTGGITAIGSTPNLYLGAGVGTTPYIPTIYQYSHDGAYYWNMSTNGVAGTYQWVDGTGSNVRMSLTQAGTLYAVNLGATGSRILKGWFTDVESTNMPTVGGTSIASTFAPIAGTMYIGTTAVALNRASATLNLAGIGTLGLSGAITSSSDVLFTQTYNSTNPAYGAFKNSANNTYIGIGALFTGSGTNPTTIGNTENLPIELATNNNVRLVLSGAGALKLNTYTTQGVLVNDGSGNVTTASTVSAGIAVASTNKLAVVIGGTTYYLLMTTVP